MHAPFQNLSNQKQKNNTRQSARSHSKGKPGAQGLINTGHGPSSHLGNPTKSGTRRGESQNHQKQKAPQGFFYSQQSPQQQSPYQQPQPPPIPLQNVITQVNQNQVMPELTMELKNQIQGFQKFSKEGCPEDKGALGAQKPMNRGKKTLVLDLDETLVHSSFKTSMQPDIVLPVDIEGTLCNVFVLVRPGTELFLQRLSKIYELVIYTASLSKYADPLIDILDNHDQKVISGRMFREHCTFIQSVFIKDMSLLGRDLSNAIIIDNSPTSYTFHQENALPILSWYDDMKDRCLFELIPLLESLAEVDDVRKYIPKFVTIDNRIDFQRASQILANARPQLAPIDEESSVKQASQRSSVKRKQIEILEGNQEDETDGEEESKKKINIHESQENENDKIFEKKNNEQDNQKIEHLKDEQDSAKKKSTIQTEDSKSNNQWAIKDKFKGQSIFKKFKEKQESQQREQSRDRLWQREEEQLSHKFVQRASESGKRKRRTNANQSQNPSHEPSSNELLEKVQVDFQKSPKVEKQKGKEEESAKKNEQEGRPVTRDPKRQEQFVGENQQKQGSPVNIKNIKAQQKTRKISNQYYSRSNQLQHLLNTENKNIGHQDLTAPMYPDFLKNQSKTPKDYSASQQKTDTVQSSIQKLQQMNGYSLGQFTPKSNQVQTSRFFGQGSPNGSLHLINNDVNNFTTSREQSQRNLKQNTGYLGRLQNQQDLTQQNTNQFLTQQRQKKDRFLKDTEYPSTKDMKASYSLNATHQIQQKQTPKHGQHLQGSRGRALQASNDRRNYSKQSLQLGNNSISKESNVQQLNVSNSAKTHTQQQNRPNSARRPNLLTQSFQNIQATNKQARQQFGNLVAAFEAQTPFTTNRQNLNNQSSDQGIQFSPIQVGSQQRNLFKAQNRKTISQRRIQQHIND